MLIWTLVTHAFSSTVNSAIGLTVNSAISISPTANSAFQQDKKKFCVTCRFPQTLRF